MNTNRRTFLKKAGIGLAAAYAAPSLLSCTSSQQQQDNQEEGQETTAIAPLLTEVGLQLYTLRSQLGEDAVATIDRVAQIGYDHVETFGPQIGPDGKVSFWGLDVPALAAKLKESGLKSYSGHYDMSDFLTPGNGNADTLKIHLETAAALGQQYVIAPVPPFQLIDKLTADDYRFMADQFNKGGELAAAAGLKIGYHNHFWEFRTLADGSKGLDILIENTDKDAVFFELDLFWSEKAGIDSAAYFEKNPSRFPLWHLKDMDKEHTEVITGGDNDSKPFTDITGSIVYAEVGTGAIDFKNIMTKKDVAGLQHVFVEQDTITIDTYESITKSYNYVKNELLG